MDPEKLTIEVMDPDKLTIEAIAPDKPTVEGMDSDNLTMEELDPGNLTIEEMDAEKLDIKEIDPEKLTFQEMFPDKLSIEEMDPDKLTIEEVDPDKLTIEEMDPDKLALEEMDPEKLTFEEIYPEKLDIEEMDPEKLTFDEMDPEKLTIEEMDSDQLIISEMDPDKLIITETDSHLIIEEKDLKVDVEEEQKIEQLEENAGQSGAVVSENAEDANVSDSTLQCTDEDHGLATVEEILGLAINTPVKAESSPEVQIIEPEEYTATEALRKRISIRNRSMEEPILPLLSPGSHRRPRRVIFDTHMPPNKYEGSKHGLRLPKFNGMGTHEIVQRMADRGHILYIDGSLRWMGQTSAEKRTWMSMISEDGDEFDDDDEDMTIGGPLDIYAPMTVTPVNSPKWRYRKKMKQVDPSSIVPNSVSSSLGSTGSASETELGTDEDEDDAELASQGWIITKAEGPESPTPSPVRVMQDVEYELIEEPEFVMESEPPVVEGPPQKKRKHKHEPQPHTDGKIYPKPGFSYSCLIAMSLKNSTKGSLPVSEIYKFMCDHFPYFKSAPSGWKNSVRHNLSLNKCFEKIEKPGGNAARKGCLWGLCRGKENKMDEEVQKWLKKDPGSVIRAMSDPENLELIERGELKRDYSGNTAGASDDEEEEEDAVTPIRVVAAPRSKVRPASTAATLTTAVVNGETIITTTPLAMSTLRTSLQPQQIRVIKTEGGEQAAVTDDQKQTIELAQLGSVQGNYLCHPNGTFTLSFTGLGNQSTRPLIIRHAQVK